MRRISPATVTFGVMAIVIGLVSAYVVRQALQKPPVAAAPAPPPKPDDRVEVVYAIANIPKHSRVRASDLATAKVEKDSPLAKGTYKFRNSPEGRIAIESIRVGQVIKPELLLGIGEGLPDLADRLPEGHRAVTITVEGADTGGKRLEEGDYIDIALTVEGTHPDLGELLTRTLMHRVLVVDAKAGEPVNQSARRGAESRNESIVTVAVPPADANRLIVAERTGTLHATLVSAKEVVVPAADDAISRRELLGLAEVTPPKRFVVEKWTGSRMQLIEMTNDRVQESRAASGPAAEKAEPVSEPNKNALNLPSGVKRPTATVVAPAPFALAEQAEPVTQ
jgi:pilus assembly protein CpaB